MTKTFKALVVRQNGQNFKRSIEDRNINSLPKGDVLIKCILYLNRIIS